jgi:acetyltransferase-like isoleucine patch superfamily enzyme
MINNIFNRFVKTVLGLLSYHIFPSSLRVFFLRLRGVQIGSNTFIGLHVTIDNLCPKLISIGNNCGIASGVVILAHKRNIAEYSIDKGYSDYPFVTQGVTINDNVQIGVNSIILPGVIIGRGTIIGAGSVVTRDIPSSCIAAGVPAKILKTLNDD